MSAVPLIRQREKLQDGDLEKIIRKKYSEIREYASRSDFADEVQLTPSETGLHIKFEFLKEGKTRVVATINIGEFSVLGGEKIIRALDQCQERLKKGL